MAYAIVADEWPCVRTVRAYSAIFTKGAFTADQWWRLCRLAQNGDVFKVYNSTQFQSETRKRLVWQGHGRIWTLSFQGFLGIFVPGGRFSSAFCIFLSIKLNLLPTLRKSRYWHALPTSSWTLQRSELTRRTILCCNGVIRWYFETRTFWKKFPSQKWVFVSI